MAQHTDHPLMKLSAEDLNMVCKFVLHSGSVKALASEYGVSYPTIRTRLDQLIHRLSQHVQGRPVDPVIDHLAELIEKERISPADAERLRDLHRAVLHRAVDSKTADRNHQTE
jgi:hypothetical protein